LSRSSAFLKRALDLIGASAGLVVLAPLLAIVALAIKLDSRGPVLFRQVRMGAGSRPFRILKFRTMAVDADARTADIAHLNKHARNGGDPRMFKIENDPRVTRAGRVLRRFSIDELPQLWNVVRSEMSLVGPRPLILEEDAHVTDWAERRLDLKPGITGMWQVLGRDGIPFEEMIKFDYLYVTSWSVGGDLRLLLRTIPIAVRGA
jgi:lipopolysaccharide/colanic/teichoic acid biosynthesis glycosyltransferase